MNALNAFFDSLFEKFLPGWKVRIAAIALFLLGLTPDQAGFLHELGINAPTWLYAAMYALGLLGGGEKLQALVKSNNLMAAIDKAAAPAKVVDAIEEAKPGSTVLPGGAAMAEATTKTGKS